MKKLILPGLVAVVLSLSAGCGLFASDDTQAKLERIFRQQLAESDPVKIYHYSIRYIRFTKDYRKALVVFSNPKMGDWEFSMSPDEFARFRGQSALPYPPDDATPTPTVVITVIPPE